MGRNNFMSGSVLLIAEENFIRLGMITSPSSDSSDPIK